MSADADTAVSAPAMATEAVDTATALTKAKEEIETLRQEVTAAKGDAAKKEECYMRFANMERDRLVSYNDDIGKFSEIMKNAAATDLSMARDVEGYAGWAKTYAETPSGADMQRHASLATVSVLASRQIQEANKLRQEHSELVKAHSEARAECESLRDKSEARDVELKGANKLVQDLSNTVKDQQVILAKYGIGPAAGVASMDFSKANAREVQAAESSSTLDVAPMVPPEMRVAPAIATVSVNASKKQRVTAGTSAMDPLLAELERRCGSGTGRVMPSATGHAHLGMPALDAGMSDSGVPMDVLATL